MILGFKTEINGKPTHFETKILMHLGEDARAYGFTPKKLTLRDDPENRWQPGMKIHFATGVRTKLYNCFAVGECKKVEQIYFDWRGDNGTGIHLHYPGTPDDKCNYLFWVDGSVLSYQEIGQLALDDGFDSLQSFFDFHYTENKRRGNGRFSFERKIIHF